MGGGESSGLGLLHRAHATNFQELRSVCLSAVSPSLTWNIVVKRTSRSCIWVLAIALSGCSAQDNTKWDDVFFLRSYVEEHIPPTLSIGQAVEASEAAGFSCEDYTDLGSYDFANRPAGVPESLKICRIETHNNSGNGCQGLARIDIGTCARLADDKRPYLCSAPDAKIWAMTSTASVCGALAL